MAAPDRTPSEFHVRGRFVIAKDEAGVFSLRADGRDDVRLEVGPTSAHVLVNAKKRLRAWAPCTIQIPSARREWRLSAFDSDWEEYIL